MNRASLRWPATSLKKASCLAGDEEDAHPALAGGLPAAPPLRGPVAPTLRVVAPTAAPSLSLRHFAFEILAQILLND